MTQTIDATRLNLSVKGYVPQEAREDQAPLAARRAADFTDAAADAVMAFEEKAAQIEENDRLSDLAKAEALRDTAAEVLTNLERGHDSTREYVTSQIESVEAKAMPSVGADDPQSAQVAGEIRRHVQTLDGRDRERFLEAHASDPEVVSAILNAPTYLSGLTEDQVQRFRERVRRSDPERSAWFDLVGKASDGVSRGFRNARDIVIRRAGIRESGDGWAHRLER